MNQDVLESYAARFEAMRSQKGRLIDKVNLLREIQDGFSSQITSLDDEQKDLIKLAVDEVRVATTNTADQVEMLVTMAGDYGLCGIKMIRLLLEVDLQQAKDLYYEAKGQTT